MDSCLTWSQQIESIADKLNNAFFAIASLKNNFGKETLMSVYYSLVYPHLSYAVAVWGRSVDRGRLFIMQKRIVRRIFNLKFRTSCRETFRTMNILTLTSIYLLSVLTHVHKNRNKFTTHSDVHGYDTRGKLNLCPVKHHHTYYEKSPLYAGVYFYNLLPPSIKKDDIHNFKKHLKRMLIEGCYYDLGEYVDSMHTGRY